MRRVKKKAVMPDVTGYFKQLDFVNLADCAVNMIAEQLGDEPIYGIEFGLFDGAMYSFFEVDLSTLRIVGVESACERRMRFRVMEKTDEWARCREPVLFCRDKKKAEEFCKKNNLEYYKKQAESLKEDIDSYNLGKDIDYSQKQQRKRLVEYAKLKTMIAEIEGKPEDEAND